jgi:hypothetical protein
MKESTMIEAIVLVAAMQHGNKIPTYPVPSAYVEYEKCVAVRESNRRSDAVNPTGKYRGMYQFDAELAAGTTYHIVDWLATWHSKPKKYAAELRKTPMDKWPAQVQTAAFVSVLNGHDKKVRWSGKKHFAGGRWHC